MEIGRPTPLSLVDDDVPVKTQRVVKLPSWLGSLHNQWTERNQRLPLGQVPFADYVATIDDLLELKAEVKELKAQVSSLEEKDVKTSEDLVNMTLHQARVTNELKEMFESELTSLRNDLVGKVRKEPRPQAAFDAVRLLLYTFNKRNHKRKKEKSGKVLKWGKNNKFDIIYNRESLEAWLESKYAKDLDLNKEVIDDFKVCVVRGELRTISKEFKGGVGIEAFWVPDNKYHDAGFEEASCYESTDALLNDPRRGYMLNGVVWVPSTSSKKRPLE